MVTQELAAIPARTVVENVFLGHRSRPVGDACGGFSGTAYERLCERTGIRLDPLARLPARCRSLTASCSKILESARHRTTGALAR